MLPIQIEFSWPNNNRQFDHIQACTHERILVDVCLGLYVYRSVVNQRKTWHCLGFLCAFNTSNNRLNSPLCYDTNYSKLYLLLMQRIQHTFNTTLLSNGLYIYIDIY